jgi:hypothetical protein
MAIYHASMMPPPDQPGAVEVDRKAALAAAKLLETPAEARSRAAAGSPVPAHYVPTPPARKAGEADVAVQNPYK